MADQNSQAPGFSLALQPSALQDVQVPIVPSTAPLSVEQLNAQLQSLNQPMPENSQAINPQALAQVPASIPVVTSPAIEPVNPVEAAGTWLMSPRGTQVPLTRPVQPTQPEPPILSKEDLARLPDISKDALTTPSVEQLMLEYSKLAAPYKQERARLEAMDEVQNLRIQHEKNMLAREEKLTQEFDNIDKRVRTKSLGEIFQSGSTGSKLGAALAILVGGVSQGLTGAKTNPALDMMDRLAERQAQKDKLSLDEKEMLRKQIYEAGGLELRKLENATQNAYRKDQLSLMQQQLDLKRQELEEKLRASIATSMPKDIHSGRKLTKEEVLQIRASGGKDAEKLITLPNGNTHLAAGTFDKENFVKGTEETFKALSLLDKYKSIGKQGSKFSLTDRAEADVLRTMLVGALRQPVTGPGVLSEPDKAAILGVLADPLALTKWRPIEMAKINKVIDSLQVQVINSARRAGISGEVFNNARFRNLNGKAVREDHLIQMYRAKKPTLTDEELKMAISKQIPEI